MPTAADTNVQDFNVKNSNNARSKIASGSSKVTSDNVHVSATVCNGNFEAVTDNVQSVPDNVLKVQSSTVAMDKNAVEIVQSSTSKKVMDKEDPNVEVPAVPSVEKNKDVVK